MLDTPLQDKLHKHLYICNPCEHSCIMMIKMRQSTSRWEYRAMKDVIFIERETITMLWCWL